ncbi:hypothetical protein [Streptomyces sp. NPDC058254]|uniref:hypothetical protein n=1 Tax=Streptomyces sp. NPDC058254 TaxID=3346406 RepID=UPI0036EA1FAC
MSTHAVEYVRSLQIADDVARRVFLLLAKRTHTPGDARRPEDVPEVMGLELRPGDIPVLALHAQLSPDELRQRLRGLKQHARMDVLEHPDGVWEIVYGPAYARPPRPQHSDLLTPDAWLVLGLPWPEQTREGWGECAVAIAPQMIPRTLVSTSVGLALDFARGLARDPGDGPGKTVFFSDITLWLDSQGKTWADLGADYDAVIDELIDAQVPQLYLTLKQKPHAILCDASREGMRLYYPNGDVEHVTPQLRQEVQRGITQSLERDWLLYILLPVVQIPRRTPKLRGYPWRSSLLPSSRRPEVSLPPG